MFMKWYMGAMIVLTFALVRQAYCVLALGFFCQ
jgi:hypothetical protein